MATFLASEDFLLFSVLHPCKLNIFMFWNVGQTQQDMIFCFRKQKLSIALHYLLFSDVYGNR